MSRPEIAQTLILLVTAGSEPTAAGLSGATFNLLRNQAALACLQAEVRNAFSSADEITNHSAQQLPYLRAVIEEALRLYPPVPSRFPRRTGKGGAVIDGHFVPENVLFLSLPPPLRIYITQILIFFFSSPGLSWNPPVCNIPVFRQLPQSGPVYPGALAR